MIDKSIIAVLRYVHGSFNLLVMLLFFFQGFLGLKIRRARKSGINPSFNTIKIHRKAGPVLVVLSILGFFAGLTLVLIDHGHIFHYPLHLFLGLTLILSVIATFRVSGKIKGPEPYWRDIHFKIGILIAVLYLCQVFLGIGILL